MGIRKFRPTTPSRRHMVGPDFKEITKDSPEKALLSPLKKSAGRNCYGRITVRHRGGGHKRMYRLIDFKRDLIDVAGKIIAIEYDPNRSSRIALVEYPDKVRRYILAPVGLQVGDEVVSSKDKNAEIKAGNCLILRNIPQGTMIHNLELNRGSGGQIVRTAGASAQIMAKEGDFAHVRLPSGEIRLIHLDCIASIGQVGNVDHDAVRLGKAGKSRRLGRRPQSRGSAMNPVDHPHGGGEGKSGQGNPHPVSPWGQPTKGYRTRRGLRYSDKFIVKRRT
ncbi:MAG TPA: 50S ribosomal protein L2 [Candidatus Omnitrophota bacterium]|nr:50S ribosomal protein L2 [Candidatus Omnitrophota bacterium]HRZ15708.1 50S ribosomal protein L2 [Candidatus Omnitrophota bacterium]